MYIHKCIILKVSGINEKNKICLPNKKYVNDHKCGKRNIAARCKIFVNVSLNILGISQNNYDWQTSDCRYERADMAFKCKIF